MLHAGRLFVACAALLLGACRPSSPPEAPAEAPRIVTLAPHLAELVAAAGGAELLVGVSAYTDYPPDLEDLPVVSDGFRVNAEALVVVRPTLVLAWGGGGQADNLALVGQLGVPVELIVTRSIADIGPALRRIGMLAGTADTAERAAASFEAGIAALGYSGERLRVFYQIGEQPLYTINGGHFISELMARCGGDNVFASMEGLAPVVSVEAVVGADPDVILSASDSPATASMWHRWPELAAVRSGNLLAVPGDLVARPGPRLAAGGRAICAALQQARDQLGSAR
jgi:iron complex transport system substrate-binding protein